MITVRISRCLAVLVFAALAMSFAAAPAEAIYRTDGTPLWPGGQVEVCWETGAATDGSGDPLPARAHPNFANLQRVIQDTVNEGWARPSRIVFYGWRDCPSKSPSGNPGRIAIHWEPIGPSAFLGYSSSQWTRMRLNPDDLVNNPDFFRGNVLHEFGHALGFSHEMDRPDWQIPSQGNPCIGNTGTGSDLFSNYYQTPSDPYSIMTYTYCSISLGRLTPWDIVGLQYAYGPKPAGSLVGMNNQCLDVPSGRFASGVRMQVFGCHGEGNQHFRRRPDGSLYPAPAPALTLDVRGASTVPGTAVQLFRRKSPVQPNQQWRFENVLIKGLGGKCLDVPGGDFRAGVRVQIWDCHGAINQRWTVEPNGRIRPEGAKNLCLDVPGGSFASGTEIQLYPCNGGSNQGFLFTSASEIRYGTKCLDVRTGNVDNGHRIQLYSCKGSTRNANQRWYLSGPVRGIGGRCLDIRGNRGVNQAVSEMDTCSAAQASQTWDYYVRR